MSVLSNLPPFPTRRMARVLAVVAIAMAAGHLVQTLAERKTATRAQEATNLAHLPVRATAIVQLSAGAGDAPLMVLAKPLPVDDFNHAGNTIDRIRAAAQAMPKCGDDLTLEARAGGLIGLVLTTPCRGQQRVVLRHAGLAVTGKIDAAGSLQADLPALAVAAEVEVLFQDGSKVTQAVTVAEVASLRRFGVQWQGADAFGVHGFEDGADFGQPGHIFAGNRGNETSGTLTLLGDAGVENPLLAQIYTYPSDPARPVEVVLEAAVTPQTCGHDLLGEAILAEAGRATITELTLAMPDCSGVGDFLVLKNLASDTKIAAN